MGNEVNKTAYSREELLQIVKSLQTKLKFYKEKYNETINEELMFQEIYEKLNDEEELNKMLKEKVSELELNLNEIQAINEQLVEENKQLKEQNKGLENKIKDYQQPKDSNKIKTETSQFDPWFETNLKATSKLKR